MNQSKIEKRQTEQVLNSEQKEQDKHVSPAIGNTNVSSRLSKEVTDFIEYVNHFGEWAYVSVEGVWRKDYYYPRSTQELFDYHKLCKSRGQDGC